MHIDLFPTEILHAIFLLCVRPFPNTPLALFRLALTCKRWRDLVFGFPALWSHFVMDFKSQKWPRLGREDQDRFIEFPVHDIYEAAEVFFNKTLGQGITRSLVLKTPFNRTMEGARYSEEPTNFRDFFDAEGWLEQATTSKISKAEFCVDPVIGLSVFLTLSTGQLGGPPRGITTWGQLTTLKMTATWGEEMDDVILDTVLEGRLVTAMPQLRDLALKVHDIVVWDQCIPWSQLRRLDLRVKESHAGYILDVLHQCLNLEDCHLQAGVILSDDIIDVPSPKSFPLLKHFKLCFNMSEDDANEYASPGGVLEYFLKTIELPEAHLVSIQSLEETIIVKEAVFRLFINRCGSLKTLCLGHISFIRDPALATSRELKKELRSKSFTSVLTNLPRSLEQLVLMVRADERQLPPELRWLTEKWRECGTFLPKVRDFWIYVSGDEARLCRYVMEQDRRLALFYHARSASVGVGHAHPLFNGGKSGAKACYCAKVRALGVSVLDSEAASKAFFEDFFEEEGEKVGQGEGEEKVEEEGGEKGEGQGEGEGEEEEEEEGEGEEEN